MSIVRTELRLLRHDPVPAAVLVGMPLVLMTLLSDAMEATLATEGYPDAPGSAQTVPGMACVFASFAIAVVGFAIFREHGWRTWPRLRAAGLSGRALLAGKLAVPALLVSRAVRGALRLRRPLPRPARLGLVAGGRADRAASSARSS